MTISYPHMQNDTVTVRFIGRVRTRLLAEEIRADARDLDAIIEIFPEYQEALDGLEGFSHIFVLNYFDKLRPDQIGPLKLRPRRLLRYGVRLEDLPLLGVFALDSPTRPNPIGITLVKLTRIERNLLHVQGLDLFDGTPVLDIKPYRRNYRPDSFEIPEWDLKLLRLTGQEKLHKAHDCRLHKYVRAVKCNIPSLQPMYVQGGSHVSTSITRRTVQVAF
jgi:tRNA-Thr(GGU) m(6)t(6)A37 methyltransferase TsaA